MSALHPTYDGTIPSEAERLRKEAARYGSLVDKAVREGRAKAARHYLESARRLALDALKAEQAAAHAEERER